MGPFHLRPRYLLLPTDEYEFFKMPKQRSIIARLDLKVLKKYMHLIRK